MSAPDQPLPLEPRPRIEPARGTLRDRFDLDIEQTSMLGGSLLVLVGVVAFFLLASRTDADTWVPIGLVFCLTAISVPICMRLSGLPRDSRLFKLLVAAFLLKMLCAGPRYALNEVFYKGEVDATRYDQAGDFFVQNLSQGRWSIEGSELAAFPAETRVVGYLTGMLYVAFGTSYFGGYLIFAWVSWLGLVFFFKAFRIAYPNAPPYLAAKLIFFLPSMLFWPSSLGKDAVMVFLVGLITLGISRLLKPARPMWGFAMTVAAGIGMWQIRPHLLLVTGVGLAATTLTRASGRSTRGSILFRVFILSLLFPVLVTGMTKMDEITGTKAGGTESLDESLNRTLSRTNVGGSAFDAKPVRSPVDIPNAMITVIYRPFVFEASNIAVLISALEGSLLIVLSVAGARWLWRIGPAMYRQPFAAFCGAFVLGFVVAFSNIGNAGILARQRVQLYPLLLLLACCAREHLRAAEDGAADELDDALPHANDPQPVPSLAGRRSPALSPASSVR